MPVRTGNTVSTSRGSLNTKTKKFTGPAPAPAGSTKVPERSYLEVPTVTSEGGKVVSTSGFTSRAAAKQARKRTSAAHRRVRAIELTERSAKRRGAQSKRTEAKVKKVEAKLKSSERQVALKTAPKMFHGKPTAGTPTLKALETSQRKQTLQTNKRGYLTTPPVRKAARNLKKAKAVVRKSQPSTKGLQPAERSVVPLARKAHRKYPDIPVSVLMAQIKQESGFQPVNESSAGAEGLSQFIPSTAASYGVKYGAGRKEQQSQVTGQAHYLHDLGFAKDPKAAMSGYTGGYSDAEYNDPVLTDAKASYSALDKPGNPKAVKKLAKAKAQASKLGLKTREDVGPAPKKVVTRFKAAKVAMKEVEGVPYEMGGGHASPTSSPTGGALDCSGAVGYVLNKIGAMKGSAVSGDMGKYLKPGPGLLTVFYNAGHTFLRLGNEYWGTSVGDSGAGGLGPHPAPSASYLASYSVGHVPGLGRKQALQMGFKDLGSAQSFPGMTLSSSGTSATINEGAGATVGKPGSSKQPIKLSATQKARRTMKTLKSLGVGTEPSTSESEASPTLKALEAKYGVKAA